MKLLKEKKAYSGSIKFFQHESSETKTPMNFSVFLPELSEEEITKKRPCVFWLSGLTCTENNFMEKASALSKLSKDKVILVCPDTSPRGDDVPDDKDSWDFGKGAGFYLDATKEPWSKNYRMYSYFLKELLPLVQKIFPVDQNNLAISGHSMGGHGALTISLKNPELFKSVSAFSPICNPLKCPWGEKAFSLYLNSEDEAKEYDSCELVKKSKLKAPILIDQCSEDEFLKDSQLLPENLLDASKNTDLKINYRLQEGFDHSYYFISSFIEEHIDFHSANFS